MAKKKTDKLYNYTWVGTNKRGSVIRGETSASSVAIVKADLRRQGIVPKRVRKKSVTLIRSRPKKIIPKDIAVFSRQMSTMMTSGIPLVQSFEIVGRGHSNPSMQKLVLHIKSDVESGNSLSESLEKHPEYFDELFCNLVKAGEQSGALETMLDRIATYKEKIESLKGRIKKTLFYPAAVVAVAFIVTAILLIFVVPQFEQLFKGFGAELPAFTRMILSFSQIFQDYWWLIFGTIFAGIYGFIIAKKRSKAFANALDRYMLRLPVLGDILRKAAIARYARTLSTTFAAGLPLTEALEVVAGAVGNIVYQDAVRKIKEDVSTGQQIQLAMRSTGLFPNMVVQMVAIGEESGSLDGMLSKVAAIYEEEVDNAVDSLSSLLEPMIMVILGILIGGLITAMYLPIFKLGSVV